MVQRTLEVEKWLRGKPRVFPRNIDYFSNPSFFQVSGSEGIYYYTSINPKQQVAP